MKIYRTSYENYLQIGHGSGRYALWYYENGIFESTDLIEPTGDDFSDRLSHNNWLGDMHASFIGRYDEDKNTVSVAGKSRDGEVPKFLLRELLAQYGQDVNIENFMEIKASSKTKIYHLAKHYSVMRDDDELRVVICPKCRKSNVKDFNKRVLITIEDTLPRLYQCLSCKSYFTFYPEDGVRDISEKEAKQGIKDGYTDLQDDGMDQHGHGYYLVFKEEPKTIGCKTYDKKFDTMEWEDYKRWKDSLPNGNKMVRNKESIMSIDFKYTGE